MDARKASIFTGKPMNDLLKYYEAELALFSALCTEFSACYPAIAGRLGIESGSCKDPHVERLIQAAALLNARTAKRLDDSYVQFTESVLENNYPHYLRPFPACSIAQVVADPPLDRVAVIPRGTLMSAAEHEGVLCKFTTAYDVTLMPLLITGARFQHFLDAPPTMRRPCDARAAISLSVAARASTLGKGHGGALRLYLNAEPGLAAALRDVLFTGTVCALVEADGGHWYPLSEVPLRAVGFAPGEALLPCGRNDQPAYRLLSEYFCFSDKFNFFDVDLDAIIAAMPAPCRQFTLHLALSDAISTGTCAHLKSLNATHLATGCTPVVNLFRQPARPIQLDHTRAEYPLVVENRQAHTFDIFSVDKVTMVREHGTGSRVTAFHPMYTTHHGDAGGRRGHYWVARRDEALAITAPGHDMRIAFIDIDLNPLQATADTVSIDLTCTNGELPRRLPIGASGGDLHHEGPASDVPVRLLQRPTLPRRLRIDRTSQWRLLSQLTLNHHSLTRNGLAVFKEMLELYNLPGADVAQRQIDGITDLHHRSASVWRHAGNGGSLIYGIDVVLSVDESAYVGGGLHGFAQVLDHFLGLYVQFNSFTRLIVLSSHNGKELLRCPPRSGQQTLA
jgi:type VI secretion system protein ImpG